LDSGADRASAMCQRDVDAKRAIPFFIEAYFVRRTFVLIIVLILAKFVLPGVLSRQSRQKCVQLDPPIEDPLGHLRSSEQPSLAVKP